MAGAKKNPAPKVKRGTNEGRERKSAEESENGWAGWAWVKNPITLFNALIVMFTCALAVSTGFLWWETRKTANATRDTVQLSSETAERQLRAYLGPFSMEVEVYRYEEGGWVAMVHTELRNFGQTPAYDLTSSSWAGIHKPDAIPFNDEEDPAVENMPKAGIAFRDAGVHIRHALKLSDEKVAALRNREMIVFLWRRVTYQGRVQKTAPPHF